MQDSLDGFSAKHQLCSQLHAAQQQYPVTALACAVGPGSFTGLRVATVAARSFAWANELSVYAVDSMQALAAVHGPGRWLCLLPLKRDTTFVAACEINNDSLHIIAEVSPYADNQRPPICDDQSLQAIGPALEAKPQLVDDWQLQVYAGEQRPLDARAVLSGVRYSPLLAWSDILPRYHQPSAPELQRRRSS